jgi:hypothetical protein
LRERRQGSRRLSFIQIEPNILRFSLQSIGVFSHQVFESTSALSFLLDIASQDLYLIFPPLDRALGSLSTLSDILSAPMGLGKRNVQTINLGVPFA